jgi:hypothetical protein
MEPVETRIRNYKLKLLEKTEELIQHSYIARHQRATFYEGLSLFLAQSYSEVQGSECQSDTLSQ